MEEQKLNCECNGCKGLKVMSIVQAILALVIALLPFVLMPVCGPMKNGHYMSCHYSGILVTVAGVVLIAVAALQYFGRRKMVGMLTALGQMVIALLCYLIPHKIIPVQIGVNMKGMPKFMGICGKDGMPCVHTFATLSWLLLAVGVIALVYFIIQILKKDH